MHRSTGRIRSRQ